MRTRFAIAIALLLSSLVWPRTSSAITIVELTGPEFIPCDGVGHFTVSVTGDIADLGFITTEFHARAFDEDPIFDDQVTDRLTILTIIQGAKYKATFGFDLFCTHPDCLVYGKTAAGVALPTGEGTDTDPAEIFVLIETSLTDSDIAESKRLDVRCVEKVPEPGAAAVLAFGLLSLSLRRRTSLKS